VKAQTQTKKNNQVGILVGQQLTSLSDHGFQYLLTPVNGLILIEKLSLVGRHDIQPATDRIVALQYLHSSWRYLQAGQIRDQ